MRLNNRKQEMNANKRSVYVVRARSDEDWIEFAQMAVAFVLQLAILVIALVAYLQGLWLTAFSGGAIFLLTFMPALIERQLNVCLPIEVTVLTSAFLFASYALGEVQDFYERLWWWDLLLHGSSAIVFGLIGFLAVYVFYMTNRIRIAPIYVAFVSFGTAVTIGTIWEIFEFLMDLGFGLNMQKSGLVDTMTDLMVNAAGATIAATMGFYYVRHDNVVLGREFIERLIERSRRRFSNES